MALLNKMACFLEARKQPIFQCWGFSFLCRSKYSDDSWTGLEVLSTEDTIDPLHLVAPVDWRS